MRIIKYFIAAFVGTILISCSAVNTSPPQFEAKFVKENQVSGNYTIFTYSYSSEGSEPKELKVYITDPRQGVITITVGASTGNLRNKFLYKPKSAPPNFFYTLTPEMEETAHSLREAADSAVYYYLLNNL